MKEPMNLKDLPQIADEMLGGLTAGERLRHQILNGSAEKTPARAPWQRRILQFAPAALALLLVVGISVLTAGQLGLSGNPDPTTALVGSPDVDGTQAIGSFAAGTPTQLPDGSLLAYAEPPDGSIEVVGENPAIVEDTTGGTVDENIMTPEEGGMEPLVLPEDTDIPVAELTQAPIEAWMETTDAPVADTVNLPAFHSNFASGDGANFPLIGLWGNAYRQTYLSLSEDSLGSSLGTVALYTSEPALAESNDWNGILSNACTEGSEIYEVSGLPSSTAVAGWVDGTLYLFQRVSFSSHGTGGQSLESTLSVRGNVSSLTLSGVGRVEDSAKANALISLLLDSASFNSDDMLRGQQSLDIHLKNGLTLQLMISDGVFSACGSWICTEFFDEFSNMMAQ